MGVGEGLLETVGSGLSVSFCFLGGGAPVDVFLVGLILRCEVGFGLFTVGFAAVGFAGLKGFGDGLGSGVFGLPGMDVGLAIVGFGPEDLVGGFPGVGLGPLGLLGEGKAAAGFMAVSLGLLAILSVGLGVTGFKFPKDGPVCFIKIGLIEECLGLNPATLSLTTTGDPTGTFMDVHRKLV